MISSNPREAIPILLERYGARVHAMAQRLCRTKSDADDVVQDVFMQAFRRWDAFRHESDPGTWLYTIAARMCRARIRKESREKGKVLRASELLPWSETTVMRAAVAPEAMQETHELIARVQAEIPRLPHHLRLPLVLREVAGLDLRDVAQTLGLEEGTVKTRLHRARLALRKAMTKRAAAVEAPLPIYEKQVCFDLLQAKLELMDRDAATVTKIPQAEVCARCRAVFRELDMVQDACTEMAAGEMPLKLRRKIEEAIAKGRGSEGERRGRRPKVNGSSRRGAR